MYMCKQEQKVLKIKQQTELTYFKFSSWLLNPTVATGNNFYQI